MKDPYYLSPVANYKKLFSKLKIGDVIQYSFTCFNLKDVKHILKELGFVCSYCQEGSKEHKTFGSHCVKIIDFTEEFKPPKVSTFDPEQLVI